MLKQYSLSPLRLWPTHLLVKAGNEIEAKAKQCRSFNNSVAMLAEVLTMAIEIIGIELLKREDFDRPIYHDDHGNEIELIN